MKFAHRGFNSSHNFTSGLLGPALQPRPGEPVLVTLVGTEVAQVGWHCCQANEPSSHSATSSPGHWPPFHNEQTRGASQSFYFSYTHRVSECPPGHEKPRSLSGRQVPAGDPARHPWICTWARDLKGRQAHLPPFSQSHCYTSPFLVGQKCSRRTKTPIQDHAAESEAQVWLWPRSPGGRKCSTRRKRLVGVWIYTPRVQESKPFDWKEQFFSLSLSLFNVSFFIP